MKKFILYAVLIILSTFTSCDDMYTDLNKNSKSTVKYFTYVTTSDNSLYAYQNLEDGSLVQIGSKISIPAMVSRRVIAVHPSGDYIYLSSAASIKCYGVNNDGTLSPVSTTANSSYNLVVHPSGRYLYSVNSGTGIACYSINPDGSLLFIESVIPLDITGAPYGITIDPLGSKLLITTESNGYIHLLNIAGDGKLTDINRSTDLYSWKNIVFDPTGKFIYAVNTTRVMGFNFNVSGDLNTTPIKEIIDTTVSNIAAHPSGKYLYYNFNLSGELNVKIYQITNMGTLISLGTTETLASLGTEEIAAHPDGKYLYVGYFSGLNALSYYQITPGGNLIFQGFTPFFDGAASITSTAIGICAKTVFGDND